MGSPVIESERASKRPQEREQVIYKHMRMNINLKWALFGLSSFGLPGSGVVGALVDERTGIMLFFEFAILAVLALMSIPVGE